MRHESVPQPISVRPDPARNRGSSVAAKTLPRNVLGLSFLPESDYTARRGTSPCDDNSFSVRSQPSGEDPFPLQRTLGPLTRTCCQEERRTSEAIMTGRTRGTAKAAGAPSDAKTIEAQLTAGNAAEAQEAAEDASPDFPIVGIGASAGGLAAFEAFFSGMPADTDPGMAFVLVQHLAPDHKSILTDLIRRYTRMQVFEVEDGVMVQPNCAYIIPPNRDMAFLNGTLQLLEPAAPRGQRRRSARAGHLHRAVGHRQRRDPGCAGHQGRGRDGHGPEPRLHRVRRHAAQRPRHRSRGLRAAAGRNARPAHRLCGPRLRQATPDRIRPDAQVRERAEEDPHPAARPGRPRLFRVQAEHRDPPHRAAHGRPAGRNDGWLRQVPAAVAGRGASALSGPVDRRDRFLPRSGGVPGTGGTDHPETPCRHVRGPCHPRLVAGLLHRRGSLFHRHPARRRPGGVEAELQGPDLRHRH